MNNGYTLPVRQSYPMANYGAMYCPSGGFGQNNAMLAGALVTPAAWSGSVVRSVPPMYTLLHKFLGGPIGQQTPAATVHAL